MESLSSVGIQHFIVGFIMQSDGIERFLLPKILSFKLKPLCYDFNNDRIISAVFCESDEVSSMRSIY